MTDQTEIRLYDTLSREKKRLVPGVDGRIGMYVCGPTVYDRAHIGNARPVVVFDTLFRLLRHVHGPEKVRYVRNFTDVDDKIMARAEETGRAIGDITSETIAWYLEDMGALGALEPDAMPHATDYVNAPAQPTDMVRLIQQLIDRGHAYEAEGHVLFAVASWPAYGSLSRRSVDDLLAGARVDVAPYKQDPMDFVLWKPSTDAQPGWESPWGRGRPGWHIECSAMAKALLEAWMGGERFQIHGGGIDLVFPHHENERAQSCAAHGTDDMADIWMHNGYLMVEGEKMSKSLGNFFTVKDLRDKGIPGEVIRYVLLKTHYRQPTDWTEEAVAEARRVLIDWHLIADGSVPDPVPPSEIEMALKNDLSTPRVLTYLHEIARQGDPGKLLAGAQLIGLLLPDMGDWVPAKQIIGNVLVVLPPYAQDKASCLSQQAKRWQALRMEKKFEEADELKARLQFVGVELRASPSGPEAIVRQDIDLDKLAELEAEA